MINEKCRLFRNRISYYAAEEPTEYFKRKTCRYGEYSQKFLYEIEFGKKGFSVSILKSIADSLETSCEYIVRGDDIYSDTELYNAVRLFEGREADKVAEVLKALHELVW